MARIVYEEYLLESLNCFYCLGGSEWVEPKMLKSLLPITLFFHHNFIFAGASTVDVCALCQAGTFSAITGDMKFPLANEFASLA